jgi:hypothetical protein
MSTTIGLRLSQTFVVMVLTSGCYSPKSSKHPAGLPLCYRNAQCDFTFHLPASWRGYGVVVQQWGGQTYLAAVDRAEVTQRGAILILRHPQWTAKDPYQDIPILVFTRSQWNGMRQGRFVVGAGGVWQEIKHTPQYVFAISSRFNADDSVKGWKETSEAVERNRGERPHLSTEYQDCSWTIRAKSCQSNATTTHTERSR